MKRRTVRIELPLTAIPLMKDSIVLVNGKRYQVVATEFDLEMAKRERER